MRLAHLVEVAWPDAAASLVDLGHVSPEARVEHAAHWLHAAAAAAQAADGEALHAALTALLVPLQPTPSPHGLEPVARVPSDAELARVALDRAPNAGEAAPNALLGAWAKHLNLGEPAHRRAWTAAVAASAYVCHDDDTRSPMRSFLRELRHGPAGRRAEREAWVALHQAPLAPWELVALPNSSGAPLGAGFGVRPCVPVGAVPPADAAVDLAAVGQVFGHVPQAGDLLVARVLPSATGWVARTAFVLPGLPSRELLTGWMVDLLAPLRAETRVLHLDDALRAAGHRLVRAAHDHARSLL